MNNHWQG